MDSKAICAACQQPLDDLSPRALCPACLMKAGLGTDAAIDLETRDRPEGGGFVPPPLAEIARLFPQLEVIAFLGKGGMGAVYEARQPALGRRVALKVLPARATAQAGFAERFNREARALARLSHPGIVSVYDFGQADGLPYFLMEYVDGATLRQVTQTRKLAPREALGIVPQICAALQYAHDEGVVHRDIKPENILIDKKGRVKIADFGIAKIIDPETPAVALTGVQDVVGTPHYMAPEQVEHPREVDHRADIFSLGVVFYEMLTGELPLGKFQPPSHRAEMDVRLDEVVMRTLEKEPARRYQQAGEVRTAVETISNTAAPALAAPAEPARPAGSRTGWSRRDNWLVAMAVVCAILLPVAVSLPGLWSSLLMPAAIFGIGFALVALVRDRWWCRRLTTPGNRRGAWGAVAVLGLATVMGGYYLLRKPETPVPPTPARGWPLPRTPEGPPYFAHLESGRIELVAVRTLAATNQPWWSPDGSPSEYGATVRADSYPKLGTNQDGFEFLLRWDLRRDAQWRRPFLAAAVDEAGRLDERWRDRGHFGVWIETNPQPRATVTLSLQVAAGPWTTLATQIPGTLGWFKSSPGRKYWKWSEEFGRLDVTLEHFHRDPDWDSDLVVVDGRGNVYHPTRGMQANPSQAFYGTTITAEFDFFEWIHPLQMQLRTRPYETVEFRNVSLVPGRRTPLEIVDRIPPAEGKPPRLTATLEPQSIPEEDDMGSRSPVIKRHWRWRAAKQQPSRILFGVEEFETGGAPVSRCWAELRDGEPTDGNWLTTNDLAIAVSWEKNQTTLMIEDPGEDPDRPMRNPVKASIPSEQWWQLACQARAVTLTDTHYQTLLEAEVNRPSADGKSRSHHWVRFIARLAPSEKADEVRMLGKSDPVKTVLPVAN